MDAVLGSTQCQSALIGRAMLATAVAHELSLQVGESSQFLVLKNFPAIPLLDGLS